MNELIKKYIAYPLAVTVFKQDLERFKSFEVGNLYMDMVESIIERMHKDYYELKADLISNHHIDIRRLEVGKYQINKEVVEFTSDELKKMTEELMSEYLYRDKASGFERQERVWKPDE
ncbi:hypothetical protein [Ornithinibacillus sp. JPR2-1]|uniref:hypothetical protein n=1 Tax=Ornithinibacillus sp. JPR2-1 TaxID=2094019 RepID=UPI0031E2CAF3